MNTKIFLNFCSSLFNFFENELVQNLKKKYNFFKWMSASSMPSEWTSEMWLFFLFIFHLNIHTNVHIANFVRLNIHVNKCTFIQNSVQLIVLFEFKRHFYFLFIFISYWIHILFIFEMNIHLFICSPLLSVCSPIFPTM